MRISRVTDWNPVREREKEQRRSWRDEEDEAGEERNLKEGGTIGIKQSLRFREREGDESYKYPR